MDASPKFSHRYESLEKLRKKMKEKKDRKSQRQEFESDCVF